MYALGKAAAGRLFDAAARASGIARTMPNTSDIATSWSVINNPSK